MNEPMRHLPLPGPRSSDPDVLAREVVERLIYRVGKDPKVASQNDWLVAVSLVTRDRAIDRWMTTTRETYDSGAKRVLLSQSRVPDRPATSGRGLKSRAG